MNSVIISGRLLKLPDFSVYEINGKKHYVAKYILVSRKPHATKGNSVNYIYCEAREHLALFAKEYFKVGKNIGVQGYLDVRTFIDSYGKRKSRWSVIAERQEFLESKSVENNILSAEKSVEDIISDDMLSVEDLPFN